MKAADIPKPIAVPFANEGTKFDVPTTPPEGAEPNKAAYSTGFPDITMQPEGAGGLPPYGQDFNGVMYDVTNNIRWYTAGKLHSFDPAYATAIGGYPNGAILQKKDNSGFWQSTADDNTENPDTTNPPTKWRDPFKGIQDFLPLAGGIMTGEIQMKKPVRIVGLGADNKPNNFVVLQDRNNAETIIYGSTDKPMFLQSKGKPQVGYDSQAGNILTSWGEQKTDSLVATDLLATRDNPNAWGGTLAVRNANGAENARNAFIMQFGGAGANMATIESTLISGGSTWMEMFVNAAGDGLVDRRSGIFRFKGDSRVVETLNATLWENGQRVFSPNNPPPASVTTSSSVTWPGWWWKDNSTGVMMQGNFKEGGDIEGSEDVLFNTPFANGILTVQIITKNFAQGFATYNPQVGDLGGGRKDGFTWIHGSRERHMYWMAIGW